MKSLYTIPEEQASRFVDGEDGFIVPVARKRRSLLVALPPEGQAAYRLFYDAEAQKLFEEAEGASERETLERIYSAYFLTSVGDDAADRLGDLYFELGRFDRAADCWLAVLRERPDTDLSPASLALKAALALARAGRQSELVELRKELTERYADEEVTLGGQTGSAVELLRQFLGDEEERTNHRVPRRNPHLDLAGMSEAVWQVRFADSVVAGMTPAELTQWESNPLSAHGPGGGDRGRTALRELPRARLRRRPRHRQDALAVRAVPSGRSGRHAAIRPHDRPEPVRHHRVGRAASGASGAT